MKSTEQLTIGEIAAVLKLPIHRVAYAIRRYGPAPVRRVGITRVWSRDQLDAIRRSLAHTEANRASAAQAGVSR